MVEDERTDRSGNGRRRSLFDPIGRIVDSVVPTVADAVDVDDVVRRVDVDDVVRRIDVADVLARLDVAALVDRIDVDALLTRVRINEVLSRIDVDALLARVSVDEVLSRIDVDALIGRVDINGLLDRMDFDQLLGRVDLDAVMSRVDIDAIVDRVDVDRIVQRADLAGIVSQSTRGITASTIDLIRRQLVGVDEIITRVAARLVRRDPDTDPDGPPALVNLPQTTRRARDRPSITGHYAGPLARVAAFSLDWAVMLFLFGAFTAMVGWMFNLLFSGDRVDYTVAPIWSALLLGGWAFVYFMVPLALTGRTFGKAVVGLRVVGRDGAPLHVGAAVVRVLVLPLSIVLLGLGLLGAVFGRHRRTLHDVAARSVEVIDWGDRPAALPTPLNNWLIHRQQQSVGSQLAADVESSPSPATRRREIP